MSTLLQGINALLKRVKVIQGDSAELASLTDTARQVYIDQAIQVFNELNDQLYSLAGMPHPKVITEDTITLATSDRDYALATDLTRIYWPLIDETNGQFIHEYKGGYLALVATQPIPANYTGLAYRAAIRPTDGQLYLEYIPTSAENGRVYKYRYEADQALSLAADTFPYSEAVYRAVILAAVEQWKRENNGQFDQKEFSTQMGRAARYLNNTPPRDSWTPRRKQQNPTDPFHA